MEQLTVNFKGLSSQLPSTVCQNGECREIMNLRAAEGVWQPMGNALAIYKTEDENRKVIYIHKNEDYVNYISYDGESLYYESRKSETNDEMIAVNEKIGEIKGVLKLDAIGNSVIVVGDEPIHYLLFSDRKYVNLGKKPPLPEIRFSIESTRLGTKAGPTYVLPHFLRIDKPIDPPILKTFSEMTYASYSALKQELLKENYFSEPIILIYALRLYDGTYIMPSAPIYISSNGVPCNRSWISSCLFDLSENVNTFHNGEISTEGNRFQFEITNWGLTNWESIISSVDIFISKGTQTKFPEIAEYYYTENNFVLNLHYKQKTETLSEVRKKVIQENIFYKVHSIPNDGKFTTAKQLLIQKGDLSNLVFNEQLKIEYRSHSLQYPQVSHIYNNRLHMANLTTQLFEGFRFTSFALRNQTIPNSQLTNISLDSAYINVYISNPDKDLIVSYETEKAVDLCGLMPYLCYPNRKAYRMVFNGWDRSENIFYEYDIKLEPNPMLDIAYWFSEDMKPILIKDFKKVSSQEKPIVNNKMYELNKMRVSEVNNMFLFPDRLTYSISEGAINGIETVTHPLSQGQFGQFPLYVFTSEGIWTLQTGTGDICYSSQHPLSREVALHNKIRSIDNAIAFITPRALMLLQGTDSISLSTSLDYKNGVDIDNFMFSDYLKDAQLGYHYKERELWLLNNHYTYILIYNLQNKMWYKRTKNIEYFVHSYPTLYGNKADGELCDLTNEQHESTDIRCITRPLKAANGGYNRITQAKLLFGGDAEHLSMQIEGATEAEGKYITITSRKVTDGKYCKPKLFSFRNLLKKFSFYRLTVHGRVKSTFHLDGIQLDLEK